MISAVLVSYRSASFLRRAAASLRGDASAAGLPLEIVAVVNSGDPVEAKEAREVADTVVVPERNLGYGGGLNAGIDRARGTTLVLSNPDVVFAPGAVLELTAALDGGGLRMCGPALFWDDGRTFFIPPSDEPTPVEFVRRAISGRGDSRGLLFRRDLRRALLQREGVLAGRTRPVRALSGAVLSISKATFQRVGPFDEGFQLYYEENDWQARLRALRGELLHVGKAPVIHHFNQSARQEPEAAAWFAASESRYLKNHHGERGLRSRELAAMRRAPVDLPGLTPLPSGSTFEIPTGGPFAALLSPSPLFRPFALCVPAPGPWEVPADVRESTSGETWYARIVDLSSGRPLAAFAVASAPVGPGGREP